MSFQSYSLPTNYWVQGQEGIFRQWSHRKAQFKVKDTRELVKWLSVFSNWDVVHLHNPQVKISYAHKNKGTIKVQLQISNFSFLNDLHSSPLPDWSKPRYGRLNDGESHTLDKKNSSPKFLCLSKSPRSLVMFCLIPRNRLQLKWRRKKTLASAYVFFFLFTRGRERGGGAQGRGRQ